MEDDDDTQKIRINKKHQFFIYTQEIKVGDVKEDSHVEGQ